MTGTVLSFLSGSSRLVEPFCWRSSGWLCFGGKRHENDDLCGGILPVGEEDFPRGMLSRAVFWLYGCPVPVLETRPILPPPEVHIVTSAPVDFLHS